MLGAAKYKALQQSATAGLTLRFARLASTMTNFHPIVSKLEAHPRDKVAIRHVASGNEYSYGELLNDIGRWQNILRPLIDETKGARIAIMGENSFQFTSQFFAALTLNNSIAMPLCTNHTAAEIEYQLQDSGAQVIVTPARFKSKVEQFASDKIRIIVAEDFVPAQKDSAQPSAANPKLGDLYTTSGYMLYTSGTSGKPKGVVSSLATYLAQAKALTEAWQINADTRMLHALPLHHVHGLVIATTLPLLAGGVVEYAFPFSPKVFYDRLANKSLPPINTFTAVPTIYTRLVSAYDNEVPDADKPATTAAIQNLKLAMCGSAALPQSLREDWERVSGGKVPLLERYGMTETGITLSQPLDASKRIAGSVGAPVPSVVARLVDPDNGEVFYSSDQAAPADTKRTGEIQLSGPVVFESYWNKPEATKETFTDDGWMKTGDIARVDDVGNLFILGRASMDIIKSGGEKLSALEIEREILSLPQIAEVSVVGVDSEQWGQEVSAVVVLSEQGVQEQFDLPKLKTELKKTMAGWKIPKRMLTVDAIPRNQMGKVNKKTLVKLFD